MPYKRNFNYLPSDISYHNKDIFSKVFSENMRNKSLSAYGLQLTIEEVFLSELNPYSIEDLLTYKINAGIPLSEEEQMQFIILPMIFHKKEEKQSCIRRCIDLAKKIEATELQQFLLCGLLVFTDKIISKQDSEQIWRWLDMTKVGRIFERELQKEVQKEVQKEIQKEVQKERKNTTLTIAKRMLTQGIPISTIQNTIPDLTYNEILMLK